MNSETSGVDRINKKLHLQLHVQLLLIEAVKDIACPLFIGSETSERWRGNSINWDCLASQTKNLNSRANIFLTMKSFYVISAVTLIFVATLSAVCSTPSTCTAGCVDRTIPSVNCVSGCKAISQQCKGGVWTVQGTAYCDQNGSFLDPMLKSVIRSFAALRLYVDRKIAAGFSTSALKRRSSANARVKS